MNGYDYTYLYLFVRSQVQVFQSFAHAAANAKANDISVGPCRVGYQAPVLGVNILLMFHV